MNVFFWDVFAPVLRRRVLEHGDNQGVRGKVPLLNSGIPHVDRTLSLTFWDIEPAASTILIAPNPLHLNLIVEQS